MKQIPNLLTLLNLAAGAAGMLFLFLGDPMWVLGCVLVSLVADVLDGAIARALKVNSDLGVQLDSLADVVSFGVLPSMVLAQMMMECEAEHSLLFVALSVIIAAATALRLGKFNLDERDHAVFYGLPAPSSGLFVFGLFAMVVFEHPWAEYLTCNTALFIGLIVLLPLLMLSSLRLWSLKGLRKPRGMAILSLLVAVFAIFLAVWGSAAISLTIGVYVVFGLINTLIKVY